MDRPNFSFRQAQAAFDLRSLLQSLDDDWLARVGGQDFRRIVREQSCRFESHVDAQCFEHLASKAFEQSEGADCAVAMILANDLQSGLFSGDSRDFAEMAVEPIRVSSPALRSAILRGLDSLEETPYRYEPIDRFLPHESRLTRTAERILPELCRIARSMDQPTRKSVAAADHGWQSELHLQALNDVLSSPTCLFPKDEYWFPSEVVELVSHVRATRGFVPCTALLLANALQGRDNSGWFCFRWKNLAADYNNLPKNVRVPILAGLRFLFETGEEFLAYSGAKNCDSVTSPEGLIDFVRLPDDPF